MREPALEWNVRLCSIGVLFFCSFYFFFVTKYSPNKIHNLSQENNNGRCLIGVFFFFFATRLILLEHL